MPDIQPLRIFVSSTKIDLEPERAAVREVLARMRGTHFSGMEIFGSRAESAHDASVDEVVQSDLYVGIVGERYGSGITEAEYRAARERGMPCLLYVKECASRDDERLASWLSEVRDAHVVTDFDDEHALAAAVAADVHNWLYPRLAERAAAAAGEGRLSHVRALVDATVDREPLRAALVRNGIAVGEDLLDSLLAVSSAAPLLLVRGVDELATDYATRIENFVADYLGTPQEPRPFGGRAEAIRELDRWLADDAQTPYLLIAAEAGRGKSAMLVHWSRRLLARDDVHVVFVPVSVRYRTNLAAVFFSALAARLARVHGDAVATDVGTSPEVWRGIASDYLKRPAPDGKTVVVLIDGLDEAADWKAGADLFPRHPPAGVRVVVTARVTAYAPSDDAWREQLGWANNRVARSFRLDPLSPAGVRDVLLGMGFPLAQLGGKVDIVRELHRLSSGDPLLVHLYVADLWSRGEAAARLTAADLHRIKPGLAGYFDRWWKDQKLLWGNAAPLRERGVRAILNLLACALAPLTRADLIAIAPPDADVSTWTIDSYLDPLERFVVDGPQGLAFNHPRFAQYLYGELTSAEQREWESFFLRWGASVVAQVEAGAHAVPSYAVQYYGAHLERACASVDEMARLITPGWRAAWESIDGGLTGFLGDIERAAAAAVRVDDAAFARGAPPAHVATEIFCAISRASVRSVMESIPPELLERLVAENIWRPRQALVYARQLSDPAAKVAALSRLVRFLAAEERATVIEEALAATAAVEERERLDAIDTIVVDGGADAALLIEAAKGRQYYWSASRAVARLIERDRVPEALGVVAVSDRAFLHDSACAAVAAMARRGNVSAASTILERLPPRSRYHKTAVYVLAVHGFDAHAEAAAHPESVRRIAAVARAQGAGQRIELQDSDVAWIAELLHFDGEREIAAFLERLSVYVPFELIADIARAYGGGDDPDEDEPAPRSAVNTMARALRVTPAAYVPELYDYVTVTSGSADGWSWERALPAAAHGLRGPAAAVRLTDYLGQRSASAREVLASVCAAGQEQTAWDAIAALEPALRLRRLATAAQFFTGDLQRRAAAELLDGFADFNVRADTNVLAAAVPSFTRDELLRLVAIIGRIGDREYAGTFVALMRDESCPDVATLGLRSDDEWGDLVGTIAVAAPEWRDRILDRIAQTPELLAHPGAVEVVEPLAVRLPHARSERIRTTMWDTLVRDPDAFIRALNVAADHLPTEVMRRASRNAKAIFGSEAMAGAGNSAAAVAFRLRVRDETERHIDARVGFAREPLVYAELREFCLLFTEEQIAIISESSCADLSPIWSRLLEGQFEAWWARKHFTARDSVRVLCHTIPHRPSEERTRVLLNCLERAPDELARVIGDVCYKGDGLTCDERERFLASAIEVLTPDRIATLTGALAADPDDAPALMLFAAALAELAPPAPATCARVFRQVFAPASVQGREQVLLNVAGLRGLLRVMGGVELTRAAGDAIERAVSVFP